MMKANVLMIHVVIVSKTQTLIYMRCSICDTEYMFWLRTLWFLSVLIETIMNF